MTAAAWSAIAAWLAIVVAVTTIVVTARYARRQVDTALAQLGETQATREEQSQPNVVLYGDPDKRDWQAYEIVIKNFGATPAFDIRVKFSEPLAISPTSGTDVTEHVTFPESIPILAPGQEWRTLWDYATVRFETIGLEDRHDGVVSYTDSKGKPFQSPAVLDWKALKDTMRLENKGIHHIYNTLDKSLPKLAKAVEGVRDELSSMSSEHGGVWVYAEDAVGEKEYREAVREAREERSRHTMALLKSLRSPTQTDDRTTAQPEPEAPPAEPTEPPGAQQNPEPER